MLSISNIIKTTSEQYTVSMRLFKSLFGLILVFVGFDRFQVLEQTTNHYLFFSLKEGFLSNFFFSMSRFSFELNILFILLSTLLIFLDRVRVVSIFLYIIYMYFYELQSYQQTYMIDFVIPYWLVPLIFIGNLSHDHRSLSKCLGIFSLRAQVFIMVFTSGLGKLFNPYWNSGKALGMISSWNWHHDFLNVYLSSLSDSTLQILSWFSIFFEVSVPFLIWFPKTKTVGLALLVCFHLLSALVFPVYFTSLIALIGYLAFVSAEDYSKFFDRTEK